MVSPPGLIPFSALQEFCRKKELDLSYKLSQRKNKNSILRLVAPSICEVKQRHIKPHTFIIRLEVDSNPAKKKLDTIVNSIATAFNRFKDDNSSIERTKYFANCFSSIFEYSKVKTKLMFEIRKLQKMKSFTEQIVMDNYDVWKADGMNDITGSR